MSYLTGFFNSSLFKFCFLDNFPELLGGTRELRKFFLDKIPVKQVSKEINTDFEILLKRLQQAKDNKTSTKSIEKEIDNKIFDLYHLTIEERETIGFIQIQ